MSSPSSVGGPSNPGQSLPADSVGDQINQNIATVLALDKREDEKVTRAQRLVETVSRLVGRPLFLGCTIAFVTIWILVNVFAQRLGLPQFDPPPFFWLSGLASLAALLTTTVVLIEQNRLLQFEEKRSHLELQVNLLTEQKTTKIIQLMEELRRDLPSVRDRLDPETEVLQQPTNPQQVLETIEHRLEEEERTKQRR